MWFLFRLTNIQTLSMWTISIHSSLVFQPSVMRITTRLLALLCTLAALYNNALKLKPLKATRSPILRKRCPFSRLLRDSSLLHVRLSLLWFLNKVGFWEMISSNLHLIINFPVSFYILPSPRPTTGKYYSASCKLHLDHSKLASRPSRSWEWSNHWLQSTVCRRKRNSTKAQFFRTSQRLCFRSDGIDAFYKLLHSSFGIHQTGRWKYEWLRDHFDCWRW